MHAELETCTTGKQPQWSGHNSLFGSLACFHGKLTILPYFLPPF